MVENKSTEIVELFQKAIKNERLSHLYLINGPKGTGKKALSFKISALLLKTTEEALQKGHMNLFFIEPQGQTIKKKQIEDLQEEFSKTSLVGGRRVYIMDHVETMTNEASNSLLKFLEEPVSNLTIGLLLTDNLEQVIKTIVSRSQILNLPALREETLTEHLLEEGVTPLKSELLPYLNKDIDVLLQMSKDPTIEIVVNAFDQFVDALISKKNLWIFTDKELTIIKTDKNLMVYFLQMLLIFYLDLYKMLNDEKITIGSYSKKYESLKHYSKEKVQSNLDEIHSLLVRINYNINSDIAFNQMILNIS